MSQNKIRNFLYKLNHNKHSFFRDTNTTRQLIDTKTLRNANDVQMDRTHQKILTGD